MKESVKSRVKISDPWHVDIDIDYHEKMMNVILICNATGEIRQKVISFDTLARHVFSSVIQAEKKRNGNLKTEKI